MTHPSVHPPEPPRDQSAAGDIINYRALLNWVRLGGQSVKRHRKLALFVAVMIVGLAAIAVSLLPRTYHVETVLLAQNNQVLALPGDRDAGSPTRAAAETVLRKDNLVTLVKHTKLLDEWAVRRAPILRFKDWLTGLTGRPPTEAERIDGFVGFLQTRLNVSANDQDGTVKIEIYWPDGPMAYRLVDAAQRGFLEARHIEETSTIAEQASILEGHAATLRQDIDAAVAEIQSLRVRKQSEKIHETETAAAAANERAKAARKAAAVAAPPSAPVPAAPPPPDEGTVRRVSELSVMIESKERTAKELEEYRQRRLSDLQAKLEEKRAVFTEAHPDVIDLQQSIAAAGQASPQVSNLRKEVDGMRREYQRLSGVAAPKTDATRRGGGGGGGRGWASQADLPGDVIRIEQEPAEERDPEIEYARSKLRHSIASYQALQEKIQLARIDLDTADAAFKYRYTVVSPPEVPKGPISPKVKLILLAALLGGVLLGIFSAVAVDLRQGVLHEAWQVEHFLALPMLTEVRASAELPRL